MRPTGAGGAWQLGGRPRSTSEPLADAKEDCVKRLAFPEHWLIRHGYPLVILIVLAMVAYGKLLEIRPLHHDNLSALSWGHRANATSFIRSQPLSWPEWRPFTYLTIWGQYQLAGLRSIESWFLVNILLWVSCAYGVYLLTYIISKSQASALFVSTATLFDGRAIQSPLLWITGRQITLACLFGFSALVLAVLPRSERWRRLRWVGIFLLLLASSLNKEYGLAFSAVMVLMVWLKPAEDRRALGIAAIAAAIAYVAIRFLVVGGALGGYCEDMGFFHTHRQICYKEIGSRVRLQQYAYNVVAGLIGIVFPGLLSGIGRLRVDPPLLAASIVWSLLAVIGWTKAPRRTLPMLGLVVFNAVLSFMVYRSRNTVFGMMGLYVSAGVGVSCLLALAARRAAARLLMLAAFAVGLWWVGNQAFRAKQMVQAEVTDMLATDPCHVLVNPERYDRAVIEGLKRKYNMSDPDCASSPSG